MPELTKGMCVPQEAADEITSLRNKLEKHQECIAKLTAELEAANKVANTWCDRAIKAEGLLYRQNSLMYELHNLVLSCNEHKAKNGGEP